MRPDQTKVPETAILACGNRILIQTWCGSPASQPAHGQRQQVIWPHACVPARILLGFAHEDIERGEFLIGVCCQCSAQLMQHHAVEHDDDNHEHDATPDDEHPGREYSVDLQSDGDRQQRLLAGVTARGDLTAW
ncbi:MAG: hypothetical protein ACJ8I9_06400 [Chthoniobacterales bacterium]